MLTHNSVRLCNIVGGRKLGGMSHPLSTPLTLFLLNTQHPSLQQYLLLLLLVEMLRTGLYKKHNMADISECLCEREHGTDWEQVSCTVDFLWSVQSTWSKNTKNVHQSNPYRAVLETMVLTLLGSRWAV